MQYKSTLFSVKSISSKQIKRIYIIVNITNSIKDIYSMNMILNSFEINKVLFNIFQLSSNANDQWIPGILFTAHRCQNSDNSNFGYNEIIVKVPWTSN